MQVNTMLVKEILERATRYLEQLDRILEHTAEEYLHTLELQLQGERLFEVLTQVMLDVCTHIVSRVKTRDPPRTYGECMLVLESMGILDASTSQGERFKKIVQMRNLVSHGYDKINQQVVFESLSMLNKDFSAYRGRIVAWLDGLADP